MSQGGSIPEMTNLRATVRESYDRAGEFRMTLAAQPTDVLETLRQDGGRVLYRSVSSVDRSPLLVLAVERPTMQSLRQLEHEYVYRDELDAAWAALPLALDGDHGRAVLVLADPGGTLLSRLVGEPWEVSPFIRVAIGIAVALGRLHQQGLIHKDIKPEHILVDVGIGAAWLTGFGIASRLKREHQAPNLPEAIAGTLAYMAPEQTGRMNRSIDARSDLYAFGVTLYQMLTGVLPFDAAEPMEMIHCHIARNPVPPQERVAGMPAQLSAIVLKLLAKTAEERYQTAAAVEADLRRCQTQWQTHSHINPFALGAQDVSDRLLIPEKLYGREREIAILHSAFERVVASGKPELVLVRGYSGTGKSSVVQELHKALVAPRGLFASGKFDQHKRDIPYATLAQALQSLVHPLLGESEAELGQWRNSMRKALGPNGQLMVDLIPELELLIGNQPSVPELPPQDAQNRFQMVFRRFLRVFARPEHPLVLFLDDLQWLDAGTLDLLQQLVSEPEMRHLLLVAAYRDSEVGPDHALTSRLAAVRRTAVRIQEIVLAPLTLEDMNRLVCDSVHCGKETAMPLAQLVHEKTGGNPFFAIQFIATLAEEELLAFERAAGTWTWDLERVRAKGLTENVVDLMIDKLHRLPSPTREVLAQLACLGNVVEIESLARIHGGAEEAIGTALWEALHAGFIVRLDSAYKFVNARVEEAAYALIPAEKRAAVHLRIARKLAAQTPPEKLEEKVFEIVNQFNRATASITAREDREQVAKLNLIAGKRAKASTAYASAANYFATAAALLGDDCWDQRYSLLFGLELQRAECEFLSGDLIAADERLSLLSPRATNVVDHAAITSLRVRLYTALNQSGDAIAASLAYLRRVGVEWGPHPTEEEVADEFARMWGQLGGRSIDELVNLPAMTDARWCATMDVLSDVRRAAQFTDKNLYRILLGRMANLSLEHGNSDGGCVAYAWLGLALGPWLGEHAVGRRFGELSLDLVDRHGLDRFKTRVYLCFGSSSWSAHPNMTLAFLQRALEHTQNTGDLTGTAYAYNVVIAQRLVNGHSLHKLHSDAERALAFIQKGRFGALIDQMTGHVRLIRTLRGLTSAFGSFTDATFDEQQFERHLQADPGLRLAGCWYWIRKLQALCHAGEYATAVRAASEAQRLLWTTQSHFEWS